MGVVLIWYGCREGLPNGDGFAIGWLKRLEVNFNNNLSRHVMLENATIIFPLAI